MGEVYAARDERLERDVAVKKLTFFSGTLEQLETFTKRFKREAISMAQFVHPYIVPVYDFGEEDGSLYLVMGLMTGGSLKDKMGEPMPVVQAVKTLLPIASALSYVHENGVIHRDVKPANILFNQRGTPMLADFGIVKLMESEGLTLTAAGTGVGTPAYMAPEQVTNDLDHRIDQYSLGVILYELITGIKPYTGDTPVMTLIKHRTEPLPDPRQFVPDLSEQVVAVLNKVLAKDRKDRYADMDAFEAALRQLIADESTSSIPAIKDLVEDIAQELAEEAIEEEFEEMAEEAREQWDEIDPEAATQVSEEPGFEQPIAEEDATALDSKPVIAEAEAVQSEEDGSTKITPEEVVEESGATQIPISQEIDAGATQVGSSPAMESSATELPKVAGKKNLIEMIDGATMFRHKVDDDSLDVLDSGPTELLEVAPEHSPGEISKENAPTELLGIEDGPTELLAVDTTPAAVKAAKPRGKFPIPIWVIPVALVVLGGLIVGLLAILQVGPFEPQATPRPTYSSYDFEAEDNEPEPEPEQEEEPAVVAPVADNQFSVCFWASGRALMEHMTTVFYLQHPDIDIRLEELGAECLGEVLNGNIDFGLAAMSPEDRLLHPDAQEFSIGYTSAFFILHRELGIEMLTREDIYRIFSGEVTNWNQLGGPDVEIIPVAAEGTPPWIYVNNAVLNNEGNWREDMVYLGSYEEVNEYVDSTWGAIGITGARWVPEHMIEVGIDGVPVNYETSALGEYPMQWENVLIINRSWEEMSELERQFIEFIYSDEGWENIWVPHYIPWYKDLNESSVPEGGNLRIAGSTLVTDMINATIGRFLEQNPSWNISYDPVGGTPSLQALVNNELDVSLNGCTLGDSVEACQGFMNGMVGPLIGYVPAFFWNHQDMDVWGLDWDTYHAILHREITNWSEVGGPNEEILIVVPEEQAPYYIIQDGFFDWEELPDYIVRVSNLDEVVGFIEGHPNALGIGGLHNNPEFIHWMRIDGIEIDEDTLRSGEYPLRWVYLFLTNGEPDEFEQALLDFIYSEEGVQIRWDTGVIPNW
jgi:serine/threonine protein kinase/ABC-type phosphate transport system substrate-binding protein